MKLRVIDIIPETMADGPGLRTSVYVAGCAHKCPGCHNPETWDFNQGKEWDPIELAEYLVKNPYTDITFTGGDPLYQMKPLIECCKHIKKISDKNIWVYTGFTHEQVLFMDDFQKGLRYYINTIVTEPFILEKRDTTLKFIGSSNQKIINIQ